MQKQILITDLDGTILKSMPIAWEYMNKQALSLGKGLKPYASYHSSLELYTDMIQCFGWKIGKLIPKMKRYVYLHDKRVEPYPGAIQALQELEKKGWLIYIVTDNDDAYAKKLLESEGLIFTNNTNISILDGESQSKWKHYYNILKKHSQDTIHFATHDAKDFWMMEIVNSVIRNKNIQWVFTPNEIDRGVSNPRYTKQTLEELANKLANQ